MAKPKLLVYSIEEDREVMEITSKAADQFFCIKDGISEMWINRLHIDKLREILWDIKTQH